MCVALRTHSLLQELKEWFVEQQNIVGEGGVALREPGHVERSQQLVGPTAEVGGGGGGGGGDSQEEWSHYQHRTWWRAGRETSWRGATCVTPRSTAAPEESHLQCLDPRGNGTEQCQTA